MSKVRIARIGWEYFNGQLAGVNFENGVSTRELSPREMQVIGANIKIVAIDTNEQVGPAVRLLDAEKASAAVQKPLRRGDEVVEEPKVLEHTRESLEAIAEAEGIKGVRKIAAKFNVKGVAIEELIDEILEAQDKQ